MPYSPKIARPEASRVLDELIANLHPPAVESDVMIVLASIKELSSQCGKVDQFKDIFKKVRRKKGITQQIVADFLGCSISTISRWEQGKLLPNSLYELARLEDALDCKERDHVELVVSFICDLLRGISR